MHYVISLISRLSDNHPASEADDFSLTEQHHNSLLAELKMLLTSRVRIPDIENIHLVNESILNYGINESFHSIPEISARRSVLEERVKKAIARFEPRLTEVELTSSEINSTVIMFMLQARYANTLLILDIYWNDCTGRFYFNE